VAHPARIIVKTTIFVNYIVYKYLIALGSSISIRSYGSLPSLDRQKNFQVTISIYFGASNEVN
jgi:hypothetical protein